MLDPEGLCPKGVPRGLPPRGLWFRGLGIGFGLVFREDPPYLMLLTWSEHIHANAYYYSFDDFSWVSVFWSV